MPRKDKLLARLQSRPKDFSWDDAVTLLAQCGFRCLKKPGSRRRFINEEKDLVLSMHEPHPQRVLKPYLVDRLIEVLASAGELDATGDEQ